MSNRKRQLPERQSPPAIPFFMPPRSVLCRVCRVNLKLLQFLVLLQRFLKSTHSPAQSVSTFSLACEWFLSASACACFLYARRQVESGEEAAGVAGETDSGDRDATGKMNNVLYIDIFAKRLEQ